MSKVKEYYTQNPQALSEKKNVVETTAELATLVDNNQVLEIKNLDGKYYKGTLGEFALVNYPYENYKAFLVPLKDVIINPDKTVNVNFGLDNQYKTLSNIPMGCI
ncbi:hypothetical protein FACS1894166_13520 [Bacilli bacterium]|nr:hypothetical protein FACS1894166_13520 [Bacilli bacterium]